jgi:hypothetical protein
MLERAGHSAIEGATWRPRCGGNPFKRAAAAMIAYRAGTTSAGGGTTTTALRFPSAIPPLGSRRQGHSAMTTTRRTFAQLGLTAIASPALLIPATPAFAQLPIGAAEKVQAQVTATQGAATRDLVLSHPILYRDRLRTGEGARLEARLSDGTVLTLGERGRLTVDDFVYRPAQQGNRLAVTVSEGAFLFVGGKIEGPTGGNVAIRTPVGTLGVRGTTFWGGAIDGGYGVLVLSGEVSVTTPRGRTILREGQGTMVYSGRGPASAAPWSSDRIERAVQTISFNPGVRSASAPVAPWMLTR